MDNRSDFPVLICPSQCTCLQSSQFWAANHDMLNLFGSDREFLEKPFWYISFLHHGRWSAPSVLQFYHAEHHDVALSWWHSSGLREYPIAIGEDVGWMSFLSRDVHKCNKLFLDVNKEGILSLALLELFRITQNSSTLPMARIIFFDSSLNGL